MFIICKIGTHIYKDYFIKLKKNENKHAWSYYNYKLYIFYIPLSELTIIHV